MRHRTTDQHGRFQARPRMRVPPDLLQHTYQIHVIEAICRNPEIDENDLYCRALKDITHGDNSAIFADVSELIEREVAGKLIGNKLDAAKRVFSGLRRLNADVDAYQNIFEFNRRFLNDRGIFALSTMLIRDAARLDLVAIDTFRGGETIAAAYGPRRTQRHKKLGRDLQQRLKQFAALDEPATAEAADRYVEYRFLDHGNFPGYKKGKEFEGDIPSDKYLRGWFRKFDKALGYPSPSPGRPRNERGQR